MFLSIWTTPELEQPANANTIAIESKVFFISLACLASFLQSTLVVGLSAVNRRNGNPQIITHRQRCAENESLRDTLEEEAGI